MTIPDTKDAVSVLREAIESLRSISHHLVHAPRPEKGSHARFELAAANLRDACVKSLPALLDELEHLRGIIGEHAYLEYAEDIYIQRIHPGAGSLPPHDRFFIANRDNPFNVYWRKRGLEECPKFDTMLGALAWLRTDAGKAAVERAKGGQP